MKATGSITNNWIMSPGKDLGWLFLPLVACWIILLSLPNETIQKDLPVWVWVSFVLVVDVGHVWSTLFRTYFDKQEFRNHRKLLILAPIICFILFFIIAGASQKLFWTILAYVAVFHFVKQQYGFLAIYKSRNQDWRIKKIFKDKWIIYLSMIYPIAYWHLTGREFSWFISGDFVAIGNWLTNVDELLIYCNWAYWILIFSWLVEEIILSQGQGKDISLGKISWLLLTAFNWYFGIVYFNSDLIFTVTNVVAHGVPYFVLITYYNRQKANIQNERYKATWIPPVILIGTVFLLAFGEEYLWDLLLYRDNPELFSIFFPYTESTLSSPILQALALAILTVPQATHYVLDGYIWKNNQRNPFMKLIFFKK